MDFFSDRYSFVLNSKDKFDDTLPLRKSHGEAVKDGFYDASMQLKIKRPYSIEETLPDAFDSIDDYSHIVQLCSESQRDPSAERFIL